MQHLTQEQVEMLQQQLLELRQSLQQQLHQQTSELSESMRDTSGELSVNDNHPGDQATDMYERGKDIAIAENTEHLLEQVILALESMSTGTYGLCSICDAPIPFERLEVIPYTPYCKQHAEQDVSERRPAEERFLDPPFGRTNLDEADQTGFDGEDAWQIVASWGNSTTPAESEDRKMDDYGGPYPEEDEAVGFVEPTESFIATDLYGSKVSIVRNQTYYQYLHNHEGDRELELLDEDE